MIEFPKAEILREKAMLHNKKLAQLNNEDYLLAIYNFIDEASSKGLYRIVLSQGVYIEDSHRGGRKSLDLKHDVRNLHVVYQELADFLTQETDYNISIEEVEDAIHDTWWKNLIISWEEPKLEN